SFVPRESACPSIVTFVEVHFRSQSASFCREARALCPRSDLSKSKRMSSSGCELLRSASDIRAKISASVGLDGGTGTLGLDGCGGGGGGGVVRSGAGVAAGAGGGAAGGFLLPHAPANASKPTTDTRGSTRAGCRNINSSRENARIPYGVQNNSGGNKGPD